MTTVGILGVGNMGAALARGLLRANAEGAAVATAAEAAPEVRLVLWDEVEAASRALLGDDRVALATSLEDLVAKCDVLLVVVKPKDAAHVLSLVAGRGRADQVVVSSMGGLTLEWLRGALGPGPALARIMPNLAVGLGAGAVALAPEPDMPADVLSGLLGLFKPFGLVQVVPEHLFDAVTAVAGSGPAFLALAVEALEDGAVSAGLARPVARSIVRRCLLDAARMLPEPAGRPVSPALDVLEARQVDDAFREAVAAAVDRAKEMRTG